MNRRQMLSLLGLSPALLAGAPVDAKEAKPHAHSAKAAFTDGKTIYLVDTGFPGGGFLLHEMQKWFNQNMPSVTVVFRRKTGPYFDDDPPLWREIKAKGNAAIMAVGH